MTYRTMTEEEYRSAALQAGVPELLAKMLSDTDAGTEKGALFDDGGALARLIGRPTTPFPGTITEFVQALPAAAQPSSHA